MAAKSIWLVRDKAGSQSYKIAFKKKPDRRTELKAGRWNTWTCGYSPFFWKDMSNVRLRPGSGPTEINIVAAAVGAT